MRVSEESNYTKFPSPIGNIYLHTVQNVIFNYGITHDFLFNFIVPMARWLFGCQLPTTVRGGAESKEISKVGGLADFAKNLRASPFNDGLLISIFIKFRLAGQYL
jgi:hypothetical protein